MRYLDGQLIFEKCVKAIQWRKGSIFNELCWNNWTPTCEKKPQTNTPIHSSHNIYKARGTIHKRKKVDRWDFIKIKNFHSLKDAVKREWKDKSQTEWKYLYFMYLTKKSYPKYIRNFLNSIARKPTTQCFLKWAKDFNSHSSKKIYKWQISTWKNVQCHYPLRNAN